jgi:Zn-dependent metalloprotease
MVMGNQQHLDVRPNYVPLTVIQDEKRDGLRILQIGRQLSSGGHHRSRDKLIKLKIDPAVFKEKSEISEIAQQYVDELRWQLENGIINYTKSHQDKTLINSESIDEEELSSLRSSSPRQSSRLYGKDDEQHISSLKDISKDFNTVFTGDLRKLRNPDSTVVKFTHKYKDIPIYGSSVSVEIDQNSEPLGFSATLPIDSVYISPLKIREKQEILDVVLSKTGVQKIDPEWEESCSLNWYFNKKNQEWQLVYIVKCVIDGDYDDKASMFPDIVDYVIDANNGEYITKIYRSQ